MDEYDVVVVGGGIAGSALASVLAPAGVRVLVLERQTAYRDKVRGEFMLPWGVAESIQLDLGETLLAAGGVYSPSIASYGEGIDPVQARAEALPLAGLIPGVSGALCVGHPQASEALNSRASEQGAVVVRGVGDVEVTAGVQPSVRYEYNGDIIDVRCHLVVGADGRQSTVRRSLGIGLEQVESKATLGGLLVRCDWTDDASFIGSEGDSYYLGFPRADGADGVVRVYWRARRRRRPLVPSARNTCSNRFDCRRCPTVNASPMASPPVPARSTSARIHGRNGRCRMVSP